MAAIVCCGEAVMDMIACQDADQSGDLRYRPQCGGAAFNSARAIGRLAGDAAFVGGLSHDDHGRVMDQALRESHVDRSRAVYSDRPTSLAFVTDSGNGPEYSFQDDGSAGRMLRPDDLRGVTDGAQAVLLGGISLTTDPCGSAFESLIHQRHPVLMVDPNIRPALVADEAVYRARLGRVMQHADIIKLSTEDLDWLVAGVSDLHEQVALAVPEGPRLVLITDGAAGVHIILPDRTRFHVPARPVKVVNTVGAGDAFNAGVLVGLSEHGLLHREALRGLSVDQLSPVIAFAVRVAAASVSSAGAAPPWRAEIFPDS
jgi:fructokinase